MFDSVDVRSIPPAVTMVGAYANGRYANWPAARARFPHARVVSISVMADPSQLAHVLDVEKGDASPQSFYGWARAMANQGVRRPTAYCNHATVGLLLSHRPAGVVVDLWVADWTGFSHRLSWPGANVVAVQYASPLQGSGGHYDVSSVWDDTWHSA